MPKKTIKKQKKSLKKILQNIIKKLVAYFTSRRFKIFLGVLLGAIVLCYFVLLYFARDIETALTFPGKNVNLKQLSNHPAGLIAAEEVNFTSSSGENIHGLYIDNGAEKTVYYFHGNGSPMEHFYTEMRYISDLGYNLIAYDFPGYGKSTGKPNFEENSDFAQVFYKNMQKKLGFEEKNLIVWGYSVGTALAVEFAKDKDFDSLVLFSPLASRYDMGQEFLGFPLQKLFFLPNSYVSVETIKQISEPTFIVHGNTDKIVPFEQGEKVYKASPAEKKYLLELDDMGHSLIIERYGEVLKGYLNNFLGNKAQSKQQQILTRKQATELLKKFQKQRRIQSLDFTTDTSLTKYVDPKIPFTKKSYIPEDLKRLDREFIRDTKGNAKMRQEAAEAFEKMAEKFYKDMGEKIVVVSTYRSYNYQAGIKARGCPDNLCAKAGHSEHQSGLAVDMWSASTKAYWDNSARLTEFYNWLVENAHNFGFHNTYQNGREVDGYEIEPWHWRYTGEEFAKYLKEKDITFAEFYYSQNK